MLGKALTLKFVLNSCTLEAKLKNNVFSCPLDTATYTAVYNYLVFVSQLIVLFAWSVYCWSGSWKAVMEGCIIIYKSSMLIAGLRHLLFSNPMEVQVT